MDVFVFLAFYNDEITQTSEIVAKQVVVRHWQSGTQSMFFFTKFWVSFQLLMYVFMLLAFYDDEIAQASKIAAKRDTVVFRHWHPKYDHFLLFFVSFSITNGCFYVLGLL
jgi:hypothetical protein